MTRANWQPRDKTINRIRLRAGTKDNTVRAFARRCGKTIQLEEFTTWQAAEDWARRTRDFTTVGKPTY